MTVLEAPAPLVAPERRRLMGSAYDLGAATSAADARALAGLDWEAEHRPLFLQGDIDIDAEGAPFTSYDLVEKERAVVRSDNSEMFGVVGAEHKILTNEAMFDFADTLLTEAGLTWAEAKPFGGALAGGKQPFLALRLGQDVMIGGSDRVGQTLLLNNGHVGNTAFNVLATPVRTGCSNIVRAAIRAAKKNLTIHTVQHSGNLDEKVAEVRAALTLSTAYMREFEALANSLLEIEMGLAEFDDFLTDLVPIAVDAGDRAKVTAENTRAAFRHNWRTTTTLSDELRGTAWGALNVVTEVIDHGNLDVRKSKVAPAERRVNSVHFGAGARMRDRAFALLG